MNGLLSGLGVRLPIIQAPMAGTSTPQLAAAVTNAGGLGSIALGAVDAAAGREMITAVRRATRGPFNVNLFCHRPARSDPAVNAAWLAALAPIFADLDAAPPAAIGEIYTSFAADPEMLAMLEETRPPVVSLHFGMTPPPTIGSLKTAGALLLANAT